jgi:tRNA threonylcarbamoyladenosine modification (KEOPS) complex Cgi121 subunit
MSKIEFEVIPRLKDGERLVIYVEVGNMAQRRIKEYMDQVKEEYDKHHRTDSEEVFFFPKINGIRKTEAIVENNNE